MLNSLLIVLLLCAISAFFSLSEISLAASAALNLTRSDEATLMRLACLNYKKCRNVFYRRSNWFNAVAIAHTQWESAFLSFVRYLY